MVSFTDFVNDPYKYIDKIKTDKLEEYLIKLTEEYFNNEGLISDEIYDDLSELLKKKKPDSALFNLNNFKDNEKSLLFETSDLPYPMMSLDKIKGSNLKTFNNWVKKFNHNYILSDKEDGISCLIYNKEGKIKAYTKNIGGFKGLDITDLMKYININIRGLKNNYCIRGELIISKENFKLIEKDFKNARNAVSGLIHRKETKRELLKFIDFIAYNIVNPRLRQSEQLEELKIMGLNVVPYEQIETIDQTFMIDYFKKRKEESKYEIDGIVITSDKEAYDLPTDKNPDFSIAFKNLYDGLIKVSEVVEVIWNISRFGYLKPKIKILPVDIEGSTITYCTAHNAKYIKDNKINKGSIIKIAKSGGVIPFIVEVIKPSEYPGMPVDIKYKWEKVDKDYVDIKVDEENWKTVRVQIIKKMVNTMNILKVKYFNEGYITRLVDDLGIRELLDIFLLDIEDIKNLIGHVQGLKIYNNLLDSLNKCNYNYLMLASNCFNKGMGIKRLKLITSNIPNLFYKKWNKNELIETVKNIKTFDYKTAELFVNGFNSFIKWFRYFNENQNIIKLKIRKPKENKQKETINNIENKIFENQKILLTGFRDQNIQDFIINNGGTIPSTLNNKVNILIIGNEKIENQKTKKAKELNIKIITKEEFKKFYNLK